MSSFKSELRAGVMAEFGAKLDDQLEGALAESHRFDGAKQALMQAARKLEDHLKNVDKDVEEGKITDLQQAEREKRRILECNGILRNLAVGAEVNHHVSRGKVEALQQAVKATKQSYDMEVARAKMLKEAGERESAIAAGGVAPDAEAERQGFRQAGLRPGPSIAEMRRAERRAEVEAAEPEPVQPVAVENDEPEPSRASKKRKK